MGLLTGKTALVTGASRGIGKAIALKFAAEGANVAFTYLSNSEYAKVTEEAIVAMGVVKIFFVQFFCVFLLPLNIFCFF